MVGKLDWQPCKSEFKSHWVPHSFGLVPNLSKKLSKLRYIYIYIYIYIYTHTHTQNETDWQKILKKNKLLVMVIVVGNGHNNLSSKSLTRLIAFHIALIL